MSAVPPRISLEGSWDDVEARLAVAADGPRTQVVLGGPEPTASPHLLVAMRWLRERGKLPGIVTDGQRLTRADRVQALVEAGLFELRVRLEADAARHDAIHGDRAWDRALRALAVSRGVSGLRRQVEVVDGPETRETLEALVGVAASANAGFTWVHHAAGASADDAARAAAERVWRACGAGTPLELLGLEGVTLATGGPPPLLDANADAVLASAVLLPGFTGGLRAVGPDSRTHAPEAARRAGGWAALGHHLAGRGAPVLDLPPCLGGAGRVLEPIPRRFGSSCEGCAARPACPGLPTALDPVPEAELAPLPAWEGLRPGARVVVIAPYFPDFVLLASTLPALVAALRARGMDAVLASLWDDHWDPEHLFAERPKPWARRLFERVARRVSRWRPPPPQPPPGKLPGAAYGGADHANAHALEDAFLAGLDLGGADLVLVPGLAAAIRVLDHPTLPPGARVVVADFHKLEGLGAFQERFLPARTLAKDGGWWPERLELHSCFPRYTPLYRNGGVPLRRVSWRAYPLFRGHFRPGPDPLACRSLFAGGGHRRDLPTLVAAAGRLDPRRVPPLTVYCRQPDQVSGPLLDVRGEVPTLEYYEAIRQSRFVVAPILADPWNAAGLTLLSMALAAGRPVVCTATAGALDHLRHGVDSLLVPPGDPEALAEAVTRLQSDEELLARLAKGARERAGSVDVESWAHDLVHGQRPVRAVPGEGIPPWGSWDR